MSALTIGKKLYIGVSTLVLLALALGVTAYATLSSVSTRVHNVTESTAKKQVLAGQLSADSASMLAELTGIDLHGSLKDSAAIAKDHDAFVATAADLQATSETMTPLLVTAESRQAMQNLHETTLKIAELEQSSYKAALAGDMAGALDRLKEYDPLQAHQKMLIDEMLSVQKTLMSADSKATADSIESALMLTAGFIGLALIVSGAMFFVVRQILNLLHSSIYDLASASEQIASAANQVSASSQSLAAGSSQQAANIEETSSASSEVNSMAQRTTASSKETAEIVTRSQKGVQTTRQSLEEMVVAMDDINSSSQKISKIIKVIDEIAFQTNILALNAAVEAARAGDAGMGFAVVADEVRNLAQRCAQAAKDTTDLIDDSIQKSAGGKAKVDQVAVAIRAITGESATIKTLIDEISLGSVEQSRGMDQITQAITQMEQVTQTTAANAEESAAAAQQLKAQAQTLKDVVEHLRSLVDGGGASMSLYKAAPARQGARTHALTSFKASVNLTPRKTSTVPAKPQPVAAAILRNSAAAEFPLDDDFKEF